MSVAVERVADTQAFSDTDKVLADVETIAREQLKPLANRIDQEGFYPVDTLQALGEAGAFACHLDQYGQRFDVALQTMQSISRYCGSTGFVAWCHDVCGLYMEQSANPSLLARLPAHALAQTMGGTALSNPMKAITGIENMALTAEPVDGGYVVSGTLPWVSHIRPGQYCGAIAGVKAANSSRISHEMMFLLDVNDAVALRKCPKFSAMEGTSTWAIALDKYFVGTESIIADPLGPYIQKIRAAFILLQMGIGIGVCQGAIDSILEVEADLGHVNQFLHDRPQELLAEFEEIGARTMALAKTPYAQEKEFLLDVLDLRAQASEFGLKATQSALLHQGARGYLMQSPVQRRIREAQFVAIVTPAIKHLRWEMNKLMSEPVRV
ncbi:acyl-CoA dehydrogenase family protein [Aurantivibrio plasticivorans]